MPLHSAMSGSELHQDRLISTATVADAGKVTTPSSLNDGEGVLRKLLAADLDADSVPADSGKVLTPSDVANDTFVLRQLAPADIDSYKVVADVEFTDIGTIDTQYTVLMHAATTVRFAVVLYGAITGADETVSVTVGAATVVNLVVPVAGSGAGVVTLSPVTTLSAAQAEGVRIMVATAGTSTGATRARVVIYTES